MVSFTQEDLLSGNYSVEELKKKFEELTMQGLTEPVKARVTLLRQLQQKHHALDVEMAAKVFALERSYDAQFDALYQERKALVDGAAACAEAASSDMPDTGIPGFWMNALLNHSLFKTAIHEQDMPILEHLTDIRIVYPDVASRTFHIRFEFSPAVQEFFDETVLIKKIIYEEDEDEPGTFALSGTEGTPIHWKSGKNCTVEVVNKTQRHKTKNITRTVEREEPCASFFNFFDNVKPDEVEGEEEQDEAAAMLEMDYEMAEALKERIIPNAVDYFLGLAMDDEDEDGEGCESCGEDHDFEDEDDDDEDESDEDEEGEESEEEEEHPLRARRGPKGPAPGAAKPECQQQ